MKPMDDADAADFAQAYFSDPASMADLDADLASFFDKPGIELDTSLYSMDTS